MVMMDAERIFVDTNVLLAATDRSREAHEASMSFLEEGVKGSYRLFASGQIFREYLVVATRPIEQNGMCLDPSSSRNNIAAFQKVIQVLDETADVLSTLLEYVDAHQLKGKRIHDANLVALMNTHGLVHLKTWNPKDFAPFSQLILV